MTLVARLKIIILIIYQVNIVNMNDYFEVRITKFYKYNFSM